MLRYSIAAVSAVILALLVGGSVRFFLHDLFGIDLGAARLVAAIAMLVVGGLAFMNFRSITDEERERED